MKAEVIQTIFCGNKKKKMGVYHEKFENFENKDDRDVFDKLFQ